MDDVLKTCSANVSLDNLEEQSQKFSLLCSSINDHNLGVTPAEWFSVVDKVSEEASVSLQKISEVHKEAREERKGAGNISNDDLISLNKFQKIIQFIGDMKGVGKESASAKFLDTKKAYSQEKQGETMKKGLGKKLSGPATGKNEYIVTTSTESTSDVPSKTSELTAEETEEHEGDVDDDLPPSTFNEETRTMLNYLQGMKEFLWFKDIDELSDIVITEPMLLVKSIRSVICHNVGDCLRGLLYKDDLS